MSASAPTTDGTTSLTLDHAEALLSGPLLDLVFRAAQVHRAHNNASRVQCSRLLSIKTGGCSEDCGYCSQSAHFDTGLEREALLEKEVVLDAARRAREEGADRFCMGAAWREARDGAEFDSVLEMIGAVKGLGLETCATLGMVTIDQARRLKDAGLDYYNHNLDTGRSHYTEVVHTHTYDERLETLSNVREAGMNVCCGGILGLGESRRARAELLVELASMDPPPESLPVNRLVPVTGTPMADEEELDWSELVRMVAAARILMPTTTLRLSAGRGELSEEAQALTFLAGANSIFVGDELLTTPNPAPEGDCALLSKLGLQLSSR